MSIDSISRSRWSYPAVDEMPDYTLYAQVVDLADTLAAGAGDRTGLEAHYLCSNLDTPSADRNIDPNYHFSH